MTSENMFITKTNYETFIEENDQRHPITILGEAFLVEQEKELYDLSFIRFAQGEVYFHQKDYEAAIFKWENIDNELKQWAKKNIADAYYELGMLSTAEEVYLSIVTDDTILSSEVSLNLFSLYLEEQKLESAYRILQEAILANPDYPNLTKIAKDLYEGQQDWDNAVELALTEAQRTESFEWFETLTQYCKEGHHQSFSPEVFVPVLRRLYELDQSSFKELTTYIWRNYQNTSLYLPWLESVNQIMKDLEIDPYDSWHKISDLFEEAYLELTTGKYLLNEINHIMPKLLINWFNTTTTMNGIAAASSIVAWNDLNPSTIKPVIVKEAVIFLENANHNPLSLDDCYYFMKTMMEWARKNKIDTSNRLVWGFNQLFELDATNILVLGKGKSTFLNQIIKDELITPSLSSFASIQYGTEQDFIEVADTGRQSLDTLDSVASQESIIEVKVPSIPLQESGLKIHTTGSTEYFLEKRRTFGYLPVVDGVLFISNSDALSETDYDYLAQIKHAIKDIPVHFVLPNSFENEQIKEYFPNANIFHLRSVNNDQILSTISSYFIQGKSNKRLEKVLFLLRKMITSLLKKRVESEKKLLESISMNEEFIGRLTGFVNNLDDRKSEQSEAMMNSFEAVKSDINQTLSEKIPSILKECSQFIQEDSNFNQLHIELNEKMNHELQSFFNKEILPTLTKSLQDWLEHSNQQLTNTQAYLDDMTQTLAERYPDQVLRLACDFKVVEDWRRDINRMTYRLQIEKQNIMLRHTPSQIMLKGAGKVLSLLPQKQQVYLFNYYKKYVENESYTDIIEAIQKQLWVQFDFFKKTLEQDVTLFYREPLNDLLKTIEATENTVIQSQQSLSMMKSNPEIYYDPIKLFETRLIQYERMNKKHWDDVVGANIRA